MPKQSICEAVILRAMPAGDLKEILRCAQNDKKGMLWKGHFILLHMTLQAREDSAVCVTSLRGTAPEDRSRYTNVSFQTGNSDTSRRSLNGSYGKMRTGFTYSQWMEGAGLILSELEFNQTTRSISI